MKQLRDFEEEEVAVGDEIAIEIWENLGFLVNWRNLWEECEICEKSEEIKEKSIAGMVKKMKWKTKNKRKKNN